LNNDIKIDLENVVEELIKQKLEVNSNEIEDYFEDIFAKYFESKDSELIDCSLERIEKKEEFLKNSYSRIERLSYQTELEKLKHKKSKYKKAKNLYEEI